MQRQSLGSSSSPSSLKLHHHHHLHGIILNTDVTLSPLTNSPKHKSSPPSSSPSSPTTTTTTTTIKSPHRFSITTPSSSSSINTEKLIHLIPVFTLLCFLLLFLLSHNPSPSDLAQFKGVKTMQTTETDVDELEGIKSMLIEQTEMNSVGLMGVEKADVLGTRSFRNLQETEEKKYRYLKINNRKLGDF